MLRVACCDDMQQDRENVFIALTQIEEIWHEKMDVHSFISGEELCESMKKNHYDVVLLDIFMEGINGIETVMRIRSLGEDSLVIFISSHDEKVKECFDYGTIAFIDKPVEVAKLEKALSKVYEIIKEDKTVFSYAKNGTVQYVPIKDIVYFESKRNVIWIHTNKGVKKFYDTLAAIWGKLESRPEFIMPHRSFIFNLKYVKVKSKKIIIKKTNETFNIGGKFLENTQKRYSNYIEKRWK